MKTGDKVALITGGSRGIGLGIARCLAAEGWNLAICGRRLQEDVQEALDTLSTEGVAVHYESVDIADTQDRAELIASVRERFGRLDALVNNAGMAPRERKDILDADENSYDEVMGVNLKGPYFLTQLAARWMIEQKKADPDRQCRIVNISSVSSTVASPSRGEYCISKAGFSMTTALWAVRLAEYDIGVYELRPGITATDMTSGVKEKYDAMIADGLTLQKRWGSPEDIGRAAASLLRGDWAYSTGGAIYIDGGLSIGRL